MFQLFIRDLKDNFVVNCDKIEILVPEYYFKYGMAEDQGGVIKTFGLLPAIAYNNDNPVMRDIINQPTTIFLYPKNQSAREESFIKGTDPMKYRVCTFYRNEIIMPSTISQNSENVEKFVEMLMNGKVLPLIPYSRILSVWLKNLEMNNIRLGVNINILGLVISYIYRDKLDPNKRFVESWVENPSKSEYEYTTASMREIAARSSTFAGFTFEDMDSMIVSALNTNKYDRKESISPIEKIIKM